MKKHALVNTVECLCQIRIDDIHLVLHVHSIDNIVTIPIPYEAILKYGNTTPC